METNELMLFDWVCLEDDPTPRQVDFIRSGEVGLYWNKIVTPPYIKPIPITPEFLERNGFGKAQSLYFLKSLNKIYPCPFFIEYNTVNNCLFVNDGMIPMPIIYVHQLQHVLRLCGIEKEIEL